MRARWITAGAVSVVAGCLVPHYGVDPGGAAAGAGGEVASAASAGVGTGAGAGAGGGGGAGVGAGASAGVGASSSGMAGSEPAGGSGGLTCGATQKPCAGGCVDIDDSKYGCTETSCNAAPCPADPSATLACESGACVIGGCADGSKKCNGRCVAINDPGYGCGQTSCDAAGCPDPASGTLVCEGSSCEVGSCGATTKECGHKCVPLDRNNGCGDLAICAPCASNEVCTGAPAKCGCVLDLPLSCQSVSCGSVTDNCGGKSECPNRCPTSAPFCLGNACVECNSATDCPGPGGNVCARAKCTNHVCGYAPAPTGTACPGGGTCSTKNAGLCKRPAVEAGGYNIDATEVTQGDYALFVADQEGNVVGQPDECKAWNFTYRPGSGFPADIADYDLPVHGVDWCDAHAYCAWANRRLCGKIGGSSLSLADVGKPAESQWLHACMGQSLRIYPYGTSFDGSKCNGPPNPGPAPVASFSGCAGAVVGLYDMSGNVWEWDDYCDPTSGEYGSCSIRGGSYYSGGNFLRCDGWTVAQRRFADDQMGIRCCGP